MIKTTHKSSKFSIDSQATLLAGITDHNDDLDVVIFGEQTKQNEGTYTAALMAGLTPAVEGGTGRSPEGAMRRLLLATCELLKMYMPKVGAHQRNVHGGGVFNEVSFRLGILSSRSRSWFSDS